MRVALKITYAATIWSLVVLVGHAEVRLDRELTLLDSGLVRDELLIGRTLRPAIESAWASGGLPQVHALMAEANASEEQIRLRLVAPREQQMQFAAASLIDADVWPALADGTELTRSWPSPTRPERMYTYVPLTLENRTVALELMATLDERDAFIERTYNELLINVLLIGLCSAVLAIGLGFWFVGRRVEKLVRMARAVGRGEFANAVHVHGRDEIDQLGRAMNRMASVLHSSQARAEQEAAERRRTLQQLRHADRLATVGTLGARVAHELGTPLNVLLARARRIARGQVQGAAIRQNAAIVVEQAEHITEAVRRLLDFSRHSEPKQVPTNVAHLLRDTDALVRPIASEQHVTLDTIVPESVLCVSVNRIQLVQALVNLAINAVHASTAGQTVTLAARVVRPSDEGPRPATFALLADTRPATAVCISVVDRGDGIDPHHLQHIFEPFFTTREPGAGTGLGLAIAHDIVRDNGGWIEVDSRPQAGSEFRLCFAPCPPPESSSSTTT